MSDDDHVPDPEITELDKSLFPFEPEDFVVNEMVPSTIAEYVGHDAALEALDYWEAEMIKAVKEVAARHKAEAVNGVAKARVDAMFAEMGIPKEATDEQ